MIHIAVMNLAEWFFGCASLRLFNKLPVKIKKLETIDSFIKYSKAYLFGLACNVDGVCMTR